MKHFQCGKCQALYKIDESKIQKTLVGVNCIKCGAKNLIRFGPVLTVQNEKGIRQFSLKPGDCTIGRACENATLDVAVDDKYVSRKHLLLRMQVLEGKPKVTVEDLVSTNGTYNREKKRLSSGLAYPFEETDFFVIGLTKLSLKTS